MALLSLLTLLASPAVAQVAPAGDLAEEADLHFELAVQAYGRRDYQAALEHLLRSNRLAPNRNVVFNIARTYEKLGEFDQAYRYYNDYVAMETDPELRTEAQAALERIAGDVALVRITSKPVGAVVYVDRRELGARGVTPLTLALPPGAHSFILEAPGFEGAQAEVALTLGEEAQAALQLEPLLGTLTVEGAPKGAQVREGSADGPLVGPAGSELTLSEGQHLLVVTQPGYHEARLLVEVSAGEALREVVSLQAVTGSLVVDVGERGALIEVDGAPRGFTPAVLELPVGAHAVRITKAGFRVAEEEVQVEADAQATVALRLRSQQELSAASRSLQRAEDAPASVTVLTGAELRAFGYQEVYDAVAGSRGLFTTNDLTYQSLGFRGFGRPGDYGSRVLVTMDGHTLNDDQIGASYVGSDLMVDLYDVEQIEIVRGPGSALYGSNAFFGVINVVTRERESARGPHVVLTADGSRSLRARSGASVGDAERGASLSASGLLSQGRDYSFGVFEQGGGEGEIRDADATEAATFQGKAWAGDLTAQAFFNGRQKRVPSGAFDTIPGDPRATSDDYRGFGELRYEPKLGARGQLFARAYVDHYRFLGDYPYADEGLYTDRWVGTWAGVEPRVRWSPIDRLDLTAGAEARVNFQASLQSGDPDGLFLDATPTQQVFSGYVVADAEASPWLRASLGGRYDHFTIAGIGGAFSPRAALILQPGDDDVIKLLGGSAFRAPSPYELFYNDGGLTQVTPDSLDPERVWTGELEVLHRFNELVSLTGAGFFNRITDLVDTELASGGEDGLIRYTNTDDPVRAGGVELELRRDWGQGVMLGAQTTLQRTRVGPWLGDERLTNSPYAMGALKAAVPTPVPGMTAATRLRFAGPRQLENGSWTDWAALWDLTLTGALPELPVQYSLGARNLLDWEERHPTGLDLAQASVLQPGRSVFFSIAVER